MTRRRLLLFGLLAGLLAMGAGVLLLVWPWTPRTAITHENAAKIQKGMTLAEVEGILGGPPRYEFGGQILADWPAQGAIDVLRRRSNEVDIWVAFDTQQCVADVDPVPLNHESPLAILRHWFNL